MKPGDVRTFKKGQGNAVVVAVGVWVKRQGKALHIHLAGISGKHTTVTNQRDSERYHRTLFRNLRCLLIKHNCSPLGDEGSETETRGSR